MEDRLRMLIEGNSEENRAKWALEWKGQGKKVIGVLSTYVPEEVIHAAGMLPWRVTGTWRADVSRALLYRTINSCLYSTHVLESLMAGELDFLDGVVATNHDQELVRLWDVWAHLGKTPFAHIMHIPHQDSELAYRRLAKGITKLIRDLEQFSGTAITEESLRKSIAVFNKVRTLLMKLYELRKKEVPPISGAEALGIVTTAMIMPKEEFNRELEALLPYLEERKTSLDRVRPRLMVSSDNLDNPAYLELVEDAGGLVAMDDLDPGSRYFWQTVDNTLEDPAYALAKRYITHPASPTMWFWDKQAEQTIEWVREFNIDGVLELPQAWSYNRGYRVPFFSARLTEAGIPNMSFEREYHAANIGQLRTRIEAFAEMLAAKA